MRVGWLDFETRCVVDLRKHGLDNYAPQVEATLLAYAVDDGPVKLWSPWLMSEPFDFDVDVVYAWNARFDRLVWEWAMVPLGFDPMPVEMWRDARVLADANHLPRHLAGACEALGTEFQKDPRGKELIQTFAVPPFVEPWEAPADWEHFCRYAKGDVEAMRDAVGRLPDLTEQEWEDFIVSERINDRGCTVDVLFARAAAEKASELAGQANEILGDLVPGMTSNHHDKKAKYLADLIAGSEEWTRRAMRLRKAGWKVACSKDVRRDMEEALLDDELRAELGDDELRKLRVFLDALEDAGGAAVAKFPKMVNAACEDDRLRGQYVFNGAGATGRFASMGVQVHNLRRGVHPRFHEIREALL